MSMAHAFQTGACAPEPSIRGRRIAALTSDGVDDDVLATLTRTLTSRGANVQLVAPRPGCIRTQAGVELHVDHSLITTRATEFDAVFVPNGEKSVRELRWDPRAWVFLTEACENRCPVLAVGHGVELFDRGIDDRLAVCADGRVVMAPSGVTLDTTYDFVSAIAAGSGVRARRGKVVTISIL